MKTVYLIMSWDSGEKYPSGQAFEDEESAKDHCKGSDGWTEYEEIDLIESKEGG